MRKEGTECRVTAILKDCLPQVMKSSLTGAGQGWMTR